VSTVAVAYGFSRRPGALAYGMCDELMMTSSKRWIGTEIQVRGGVNAGSGFDINVPFFLEAVYPDLRCWHDGQRGVHGRTVASTKSAFFSPHISLKEIVTRVKNQNQKRFFIERRRRKMTSLIANK